MKKITLVAFLLSVFALMGAQDWTAIEVPNGDFNDSTTVIPANWVTTHETEPAARETHTYNEEKIWCGVVGYTGDGTYKRGDFLNFTGATIGTEAIEYKLSTMYVCSWIAKVDSFQFVSRISAWDESADSTMRTVIASDSVWVSVKDAWDTLSCMVSLDATTIADLSGKQLVAEFGISPNAMTAGAITPALASWIRFTDVSLAYTMGGAASLQNVESSRANVFVSQNMINVQNNVDQATELKLYNAAGQLLKQSNFNSSNASISLGDFKSGIYLVTLSNTQGVQTHKVFVK